MKITRMVVAGVVAGALALGVVAPASAADPTVTGTVRSAAGEPVAGIPVGYLEPATLKFGLVQTDATGHYSLPLPATLGPVILYANLKAPYSFDGTDAARSDLRFVGSFYGAGGTRDYIYQSLVPFSPAGTTADLVVDQPGSITVTGGAALARYSLVSASTVPGPTVASGGVTPDAANTYTWGGLIPGRYSVVANHALPEVDVVSEPIVVTAGNTTVYTPAPTVRGGWIYGTVKRGSKPVAKAVIRATHGSNAVQVTSDAEGRYIIQPLPTGTWNVTFSRSGDFGSATVSVPSLAEGVEAKLTFPSAKKTGQIGGSIAGYGGRKISGASVIVRDSKGRIVYFDRKPGVPNIHLSKAKFRLSGVAPGLYSVYVKNRTSTKYAVKKVRVSAGKTASVGTLTPTRKTVALSGKFVDEEVLVYQRVSNASVSVAGPRAYLAGNKEYVLVDLFDKDIASKYRIAGLIPGSYVVVENSYRTQPETHAVKLTRSKKLTLTGGLPLATFAGQLVIATTAGEFPAVGRGSVTPESRPILTRDEDDGPSLNTFESSYPAWTSIGGETYNGAAVLDSVSADPFPLGSPAWVVVPPGTIGQRFTSAGGILNLGRISLGVGR